MATGSVLISLPVWIIQSKILSLLKIFLKIYFLALQIGSQ